MKKTKSKARYDNRRIRLRTGESQRDNGTYVYRWTDQMGKRHAIYAPNLDELRKLEEEIVVDKHDGIRPDMKNMSLNDLYNLWTQLKKGIKDSTFKNYMYMYELFVMPVFGKKRICDIKKSDVRKFYNQLADEKGLKVATIDNIHNVLHQVFQVAVDDGMIRVNPTDNMLKELKLAHGFRTDKRKSLTVEQQDLFFSFLRKSAKYKQWYPVFFIMANTGMRVGEITGLRWCDVDIEKGIICINHTLVYYNHRDEKGCYYSINTPKTKAGWREIPMTDAVKEAFILQKKYREEVGLVCKARIDGYDDFIFLNRDGNVQNQGTLNRAIQRIMIECNGELLDGADLSKDITLIPHFSCHILRHTFATRLCESGINLKVIQSVLGHADVATTMNIYIDVTEDLKKREMAAFGEYLAKANGV